MIYFFFFQAEDGIRDIGVTGVQTCALPISRYRHGEAVGLGLLAALRLSGQDALREHVSSLLEAQRLPVSLEGLDADAVVEATARDKKRVAGAVPFVLVDAPGEV